MALTVTVPVLLSTDPALARAMLFTKAGSWNSTVPEGWSPVRVSVTDVPLPVIESPMCRPSVVGKFALGLAWPPRSQESRHARPPPAAVDRCAASESRSSCWRW